MVTHAHIELEYKSRVPLAYVPWGPAPLVTTWQVCPQIALKVQEIGQRTILFHCCSWKSGREMHSGDNKKCSTRHNHEAGDLTKGIWTLFSIFLGPIWVTHSSPRRQWERRTASAKFCHGTLYLAPKYVFLVRVDNADIVRLRITSVNWWWMHVNTAMISL